MTEDDAPLIRSQEEATAENMFNDMRQGNDELRGTFVGTVNFIAPEMIQESESSCCSDLWALGCIVYKMCTGKVAFPGMSEVQVFPAVLGRKIEWPPDLDPVAKDLIDKLLQIEPSQRLGAPDSGHNMRRLKMHPFFEGIDFKSDLSKTLNIKAELDSMTQ